MEHAKASERVERPKSGPLVWYAWVFGHHPDTDEISRYWIAWDGAGCSVFTKNRGSRLDLIRRVSGRWGTDAWMVRVAGTLSGEALEVIVKATRQEE